MEDNYPGQNILGNFQEDVVDAIVKGDLAAFKKCHVGKNDINRRLLHPKELKPVPKYNKDQNYINIKGPTILMFAILCEQDEIVEYILDTTNPNVSIKNEGYNCLHLAAMVKDPKCLKLLLQHEWIQDNIDEPVDILDSHAGPGEKTTALHIAVSNRLYDNVILLTSSFPKPRWSMRRKQQKHSEDNDDDDYEEDFEMGYNVASINQKSDSGKTPLFIAVSNCDYKMVKILLSRDADIYVRCANGVTPLNLAQEMRHRYLETNQEKSKSEIDEINLIVSALRSVEMDEFDIE